MREGEQRADSRWSKRGFAAFIAFLSLLLSFGAGYTVGHRTSTNITPTAISSDIGGANSSDISPKTAQKEVRATLTAPAPASGEAGLVLISQKMGEDEEGLFIYGTVKNTSENDYSIVQVEFDLCDSRGESYHVLKEKTTEALRRNENWGFTLYVPYTEREKFSSYRLRSLSGVR